MIPDAGMARFGRGRKERSLERRIEEAWVRFLRAFAAFNGLVILWLALMITADVLVRWITGRPFVGVFEISRILFVPVIFMVLALVQWTDRQVRVDALVGRTRGRVKVSVRAFDQVLTLGFFLILLWTGSENWLEAFQRDYVGMGMLEIPHAIPMGFLIIGTFLMVLTLVLLLLKSVRQLITGVGADESVLPYSPPTEET